MESSSSSNKSVDSNKEESIETTEMKEQKDDAVLNEDNPEVNSENDKSEHSCNNDDEVKPDDQKEEPVETKEKEEHEENNNDNEKEVQSEEVEEEKKEENVNEEQPKQEVETENEENDKENVNEEHPKQNDNEEKEEHNDNTNDSEKQVSSDEVKEEKKEPIEETKQEEEKKEEHEEEGKENPPSSLQKSRDVDIVESSFTEGVTNKEEEEPKKGTFKSFSSNSEFGETKIKTSSKKKHKKTKKRTHKDTAKNEQTTEKDTFKKESMTDSDTTKSEQTPKAERVPAQKESSNESKQAKNAIIKTKSLESSKKSEGGKKEVKVSKININAVQQNQLDDTALALASPTAHPRATMKKVTQNRSISRASMSIIEKGCPEETTLLKLNDIILMHRNDVKTDKQDELITGIMIITTYKFMFISGGGVRRIISVPLTKISVFKKVNSTDKVHQRLYVIETKENKKYIFSFDKKRQERRNFNNLMKQYVEFGEDILPMFIFKSSAKRLEHEVYNVENEFKRQGVTEDWKLFDGNDKYELVPTYPSKLYVPKEADLQIIKEVMQHRSKKRFPCLTWYNKVNNAVIIRSAQPLPGIVQPFTGKNTSGDVEYLKLVQKDVSKKLHILDSRPKLNAVTNKAAGGGYEDESSYPFVKLEFESIENIHYVREKWVDMCHHCMKNEDKLKDEAFLKSQQVIDWFALMKTIFDSAIKVCKYIKAGENVLVHCSDGWDRTSQCCALSELMLDKYYRTIDGFIVLIEKDWKSFGHKFMTRQGIGMKGKDGQYSPIFYQFIEAVSILLRQFPTAFEFNDKFLLELNDATYCSDFGTFLYDSERERMKGHVENLTPSFWEYIFSRKCIFTNSKYENGVDELDIDQPIQLTLWESYYARH